MTVTLPAPVCMFLAPVGMLPALVRRFPALSPPQVIRVECRAGHGSQQKRPANQPHNTDTQYSTAPWLSKRIDLLEIREPHVIAERMRKERRHKVPGAHEKKRRVAAKQGGVGELEAGDE